mgnify:CR=1 FL=1
MRVYFKDLEWLDLLLKKLRVGAEQGHRYWCIMTLATYAKKCNVSYEELENDAYGLIPFMNSIGNEPFTEDDVIKALEAYNDSYITYPIDTIVNRTGIPIEKNKRNFRKQNLHLKLARAYRDILQNEKGVKNWYENSPHSGRKSKKEIVEEWKKNNPDGKKMDCHRDTGLSRVTIDKWW